MKRILTTLLLGALLTCSSLATVITFTGGTALDANGNTHVTSQDQTYFNIVSYTENGFELDYMTNGNYQSQTVGNYYGQGNDVIHGHWTSGLQSIDIKNVAGYAFDLNYFIITSNTSHGGGEATGSEQVYVQGYRNGSTVTSSYLLPSEDWGLQTTTNIILNSEFDNIDMFRISGSGAFCFGMDAFYINQAAPVEGPALGNTTIPETSSMLLGSLGMIILLRRRR